MSCALEIERETPAAADGLALSDLWLLPLLLLVQVVVTFSRHLAKLKAMRRTRPMPKDWRSFYSELRRCEWAIRQLTFAGARQIILGQDLDLAALGHDPEPPESFQPPLPRSALAMHRRMEDIARFHADPEGFIRRCANRIRARTCGPGPSNPSHSAAAPSCLPGRNGPVEVFLFFSSDVFPHPAAPASERIRAPPGLAPHSQNSLLLHLSALPARP
ncbi:MAG TPA: hypothetical protein VFV70_08390, partial [Hyphomonadaceae bacterium]|nr:hypothetical protein [Hyphomonadaceae bacterium]